MKKKYKKSPLERYFSKKNIIYFSIIILIILLMALIEFSMGRLLICDCNNVKIWSSSLGFENSQHLFDWYSFTHILHGIGFYLLLWLFFKKMPNEKRFILAVLIECAWEILENTPMVIERYRMSSLAFNYYGDTILNSLGDVLSMSFGYFISKKSKIWVTILVVLTIEIVLLIFIGDNLLMNIKNLINPS